MPGFLRALRDPFVPARVAGLKSIVATLGYHSPMSCCQRIIPALSPLLLDPVQVVREASFQVDPCALLSGVVRRCAML